MITHCYKVTNGNLQSATSRSIPTDFVIQYGLNETATATKENPIFCFSTFIDAKDYANLMCSEMVGGARIFKAKARNEVKKKKIAYMWDIKQFILSRLAHKSTEGMSRAPLAGSRFFTEVTLTEEVTPANLKN